MTRRKSVAAATLLCFALLVPILALSGGMPNAKAFSGIDVQFEHPAFAGINETVKCKLTITGGPAEDKRGNFSYNIEMLGLNTTVPSPSSGRSESGQWFINITMPPVAHQSITLRINATSTEDIGPFETVQADFKMEVVLPILIQATVFNSGSVAADNVTAKFYADGVLLSTQTFSVSAGGSKLLAYNWTFLKISSGKHVVSVTVDEPNKIVEFSDGNNAISRTIYVGKQSNPLGAVLTGGVIVLAILVALMWMQKPVRRKKPGT